MLRCAAKQLRLAAALLDQAERGEDVNFNMAILLRVLAVLRSVAGVIDQYAERIPKC